MKSSIVPLLALVGCSITAMASRGSPGPAFVPSLPQKGLARWSGLGCRRAIAPETGVSSRRVARKDVTVMKLNNGYDDIPISDRVLSTLPYLLPIADGINYGRFLAFYFPQVAAPVYAVLNPFLAIYKSSPFASLGIYLALIYIGRSNAVSRFVRFNIQQSVVLDVALILPSLLFAVIQDAPLPLQETLSNTIFFALVASIGYVAASLTVGVKPNQIPVVSEAAERAVGPF